MQPDGLHHQSAGGPGRGEQLRLRELPGVEAGQLLLRYADVVVALL